MHSIYLLICGSSRYYGRTSNLGRRKNQHLALLVKNKHHNKRLQNSFNKHQEVFFVEVIGCNKEDAEFFEQLFIDNTDNCNQADAKHGASCGERNCNYGKPLSPCHKEKISKSRLGVKHSKKTRDKISNSLKGSRHPLFDHRIFHFVHPSKGSFIGLRSDFIKTHSLNKTKVAQVINNKSKSHKGWILKGILKAQN